LTIKQHALNSILDGSRSPSPSAPLTYAKEQELLKDETVRAFKEAVPSDDSDSEDDLLVPREKTKDELELEDEEYRDFLQREVGKEINLKELITVEKDVEVPQPDEEDDEVKLKKKEKKKRKDKSKKEKRSEETDQDFLVKYATLVILRSNFAKTPPVIFLTEDGSIKLLKECLHTRKSQSPRPPMTKHLLPNKRNTRTKRKRISSHKMKYLRARKRIQIS